MRKIFMWTTTLTLLFIPSAAASHGVDLRWQVDRQVTVEASYDCGGALSGAEVRVFTADSDEPFLSGVCDEDGRFVFIPDSSLTGRIDVQVLLEGHGGWIHLPPADASPCEGGSSSAGRLPVILALVCVIWGLMGTALYFRSRRGERHASS